MEQSCKSVRERICVSIYTGDLPETRHSQLAPGHDVFVIEVSADIPLLASAPILHRAPPEL